MISVKTRQTYLKNLGYYKGKIDGIEGAQTKKAYLSIQQDYFPKKYVDGIYGNQTEILLRNAERVRLYTKNFTLKEFRCYCGGKYCTGYPALLSKTLLKYAQDTRNKWGTVNVSSGLRCEKYNSISGGIRGSKHMSGKAFDWYNSKTFQSFEKRKEIVNWYVKKPLMNYGYCDGYARTKWSTSYPDVPSMYKSIHFDVI